MIFDTKAITVTSTASVLSAASNLLFTRGHQLVAKAQELHAIDKRGTCSGAKDAAIWGAMVGLTLAEGIAVSVALCSVLVMLAGLMLGALAGDWYYNKGGEAAIAQAVAKTKSTCEAIGVWIGTNVYVAICVFRGLSARVESAKALLALAVNAA